MPAHCPAGLRWIAAGEPEPAGSSVGYCSVILSGNRLTAVAEGTALIHPSLIMAGCRNPSHG